MNDELVSHNNSNGGWDVLNKWVSMLKEEGCMFDPLKDRRGGGWPPIVSCIVFSVG